MAVSLNAAPPKTLTASTAYDCNTADEPGDHDTGNKPERNENSCFHNTVR